MVQDSDEPDPETGELAWTEERDDMDDGGEGGAEKVYIGKVRVGVGGWREGPRS